MTSTLTKVFGVGLFLAIGCGSASAAQLVLACEATEQTNVLLDDMDQLMIDFDTPAFELRKANTLGTNDPTVIRYEPTKYTSLVITGTGKNLVGAGSSNGEATAFALDEENFTISFVTSISHHSMTYRCSR